MNPIHMVYVVMMPSQFPQPVSEIAACFDTLQQLTSETSPAGPAEGLSGQNKAGEKDAIYASSKDFICLFKVRAWYETHVVLIVHTVHTQYCTLTEAHKLTVP